jgi:hypothetical protein
MGVGAQLQAAAFDQILLYAGLFWIVLAIATGLWASETKKRRFWVWVGLSLLIGPVAWWLLMRGGVAIPASVAVDCPKCGRKTRDDMRRCLHCKALLEEEKPDKAGEVGRQAATMLFTARRLLSATRNAADAAANKPTPRRRVVRKPPE